MTITAKFASVCPCCGLRIQPGTKVEWRKGSPAHHIGCVGTKPAAATASRSTHRYVPGAGAAANVRGYSSYCTNRPGCGCFDCE